MQKATPLILVLILATTATYLSLRTKAQPSVAPVTVPQVVVPAKVAEPAKAANEGATAKPEQDKPEVAAEPAKVVAKPWAQAASDIPPDAGAQFGVLNNGMRYIIYPNREPQGRVSLRLHIAAGSLMEADDQRGIAHFIEHMAFNGTKHYTAKELVPKMQRLGIGFGANINAFTSFDETVYMLDLPDLTEDTVGMCFTVMRDFGDGLLLEPEEIQAERGIILSEKVRRDTVSNRLMQKQFNKLLPDSLVAKRFPIGEDEVIKTATRERFVDLYGRYYTPDRMTFVVVGDVKADEVRERIEKTFGSMVKPANAGSDPDLGKVVPPEGIEASVFDDKEVPTTELSLMRVTPLVARPDTSASRAADLKLDMAHAILGRRFERISKESKSPVAQGSASRDEIFNHVDLGSISVVVADDRWKDVVPVLEKEFRRVLEHGFTETEIAEAKSNILNVYQQAVDQKATRKSDRLALEMVKTLNANKVISDPETDLKLVKECLDGIDASACHKAFKEFWEVSGYHLVLTTKQKPENGEKDLAALYEESRGTPVEAPSARAVQVFGYNDFGRPGTVTTRKEVADLGITQLVLSNRVRINLKRTDFEQGKVRVMARIGSGKLSQPKDMPMLDLFARSVFEGGGLGKHSNDDLQQILAGRNVESTLTIGDDALNLSGVTTAADFATQCQLMCASITDPGYREEAIWQFQKAIPMIDQQLKHTAAGPQLQMQGWLHGGDSRYGLAPMKKLASYTLADVKRWLTPELSRGYLELSVIGDFEIDKVLPDLLATFGALPNRSSTPPTLADARKVKFPNAPSVKTFTYDSKIKQGTAVAVWKTAGMRNNQKEVRRLNLLAEILGDRLRMEIREKLGASYSPDAGVDGSDALEGMGYVMSESVGKPADLELLLNTMREQADQIATGGATADELDRALKPTLSQLEKSLRDNGYWLATVMNQSQLDPKRLDLARTRDADYAGITLKEINALAKKYLAAENAIFISIKSVGDGAEVAPTAPVPSTQR